MSVPEKLIVVAPVYEDCSAATCLVRDLSREFPGVTVILVDDGSVHQRIDEDVFQKTEVQGVIIRLNRNVGHQHAIAVGLNYAHERYPGYSVVVMDSDGEDSPRSIHELLDRYRKQDCDVVVALRKSRVETWKFKVFYFFYRIVFKVLTGRRIGFGNFMLISPSALTRLTTMNELWLHIAGCVLSSKLQIAFCKIDRAKRYDGVSKMNFSRLVLHAFKAMMVFAEDVFVRIGIACAVVITLLMVMISTVFVLKVIDMATPGWASTLIIAMSLMAIQVGIIALLSLFVTLIAKSHVQVVDYKQYIKEVR